MDKDNKYYVLLLSKMTYNLVLIPDSYNHHYPIYVIDLLNQYREKSFVLTLDKQYLESVCPYSHYLERNYKVKGKDNVSILSIGKQIINFKPSLVVLDNCFWESKNYLLGYMLYLHKWYKFTLVNVLQIKWAKNSDRISKTMSTQNIIAPSWRKKSLEWIIDIRPKSHTHYYDEGDLYSQDYCVK